MTSKNKKHSNNWVIVGNRLQTLRGEMGLTQQELAKKLNTSQTTINQVEHGSSGRMMIEAITFFLKEKHVNPAWILLENNKGHSKYVVASAITEQLQRTKQSIQDTLDMIGDI